MHLNPLSTLKTGFQYTLECPTVSMVTDLVNVKVAAEGNIVKSETCNLISDGDQDRIHIIVSSGRAPTPTYRHIVVHIVCGKFSTKILRVGMKV